MKRTDSSNLSTLPLKNYVMNDDISFFGIRFNSGIKVVKKETGNEENDHHQHKVERLLFPYNEEGINNDNL